MSLLLPKTAPFRSASHLQRVSEMACLVTNRPGPCDPHHLKLGWYAKGIKPPDDWVVPLIHAEHVRLHTIGEKRYWLTELAKQPHLLGEFIRAYAKSLRSDEMTDYGR